METNKLLRVRLYIISFAFIFSIIYGCNEPGQQVNKEFLRFEEMLVKSGLRSADSMTYILWIGASCHGCRDISTDFVQHVTKRNVKIISPAIHAYFLPKTLEEMWYYIDEKNIFGKKYIGIDNVGIIGTVNGKVYSIKNYEPDQMESFLADLNR